VPRCKTFDQANELLAEALDLDGAAAGAGVFDARVVTVHLGLAGL